MNVGYTENLKRRENKDPSMLIFSGIELIFFIAAWYGSLFWICDQNSVDNTGMF